MSFFNQNGKKYIEEVRKIEPTDPAHADVINALAQDIINNEAFLKKMSEEHLNDTENPHKITPASIGAEAMYVQEVDLSDTSVYNENTWYPVVGSNVITDNNLLKKGYRRIKCNVTLNSGTHPSWSSHDSGFSCNLELLAVMGQWGSATATTIVLDYSYSQCEKNPLGYTQITTGNNPVIYCRGGGKYYMYSEFSEQTWTPYTTEHGYGGMTVKPTSSCPGIFNTKKATVIADLDGNAATATKATQDEDGNVIADTYVKNNDKNISIGYDSSVASESSNSIAIGNQASSNTSFSVAIGDEAINSKNRSVAIGKKATNDDSNSVAIGNEAINSKGFSIAIGSGAKNAGVHCIAIGRDADSEGIGCVTIGMSAKTSSSDGYVYQIGSDTSISALRCKVALSVTSDIRDKTDIREITNATEFLNEINPFTYVSNTRDLYSNEDLTDEEAENYKKYGFKPYDKVAHKQGTKKGERRRIGVSAQEVQEALTKVYGSADYVNLVNDNLHDVDTSEIPEGVESHLTVTYESFIPFLVKAVQELSEKNKKLHARIETLENKNTF